MVSTSNDHFAAPNDLFNLVPKSYEMHVLLNLVIVTKSCKYVSQFLLNNKSCISKYGICCSMLKWWHLITHMLDIIPAGVIEWHHFPYSLIRDLFSRKIFTYMFYAQYRREEFIHSIYFNIYSCVNIYACGCMHIKIYT